MNNPDHTIVALDSRSGEVLLIPYNSKQLDEDFNGDIYDYMDWLEDEDDNDFEYHSDLQFMAVEKVIIKSV